MTWTKTKISKRNVSNSSVDDAIWSQFRVCLYFFIPNQIQPTISRAHVSLKVSSFSLAMSTVKKIQILVVFPRETFSAVKDPKCPLFSGMSRYNGQSLQTGSLHAGHRTLRTFFVKAPGLPLGSGFSLYSLGHSSINCLLSFLHQQFSLSVRSFLQIYIHTVISLIFKKIKVLSWPTSPFSHGPIFHFL